MTLHTSTCSFSYLFFLTLLHVQPSLATSHSHTTYNFLHNICIFYSSLQVMHPCGLELAIALGTFSKHFVLLPRLPSLLPRSHLTCHLSSKICQLSQVQLHSLCLSLHFFSHHQPLVLLNTSCRQRLRSLLLESPLHRYTSYVPTSDNLYIGSSFFRLLFYTRHTAICLVLLRLPYLLLLSLLSSFLHSLLTLSLPCLPSISVSCLATPLYFFAINTWSSAYKSSHGSPTLKPLVTISITTTNSRGL